MWERAFDIIWGKVKIFRPAILLGLVLLSFFSASNLNKLYEPKPLVPLVKIESVEMEGNSKDLEAARAIVVSVTGAVNKPGVYRFDLVGVESSGLVVNDLISKAGGLTKKADQAYIAREINLAAKLQDGQQLYIPTIEEQKLLETIAKAPGSSVGGSGSSAGGTEQPVAGKVNINTATAAALEALPGVGPATAEKIIAGRPFKTIEDLKNVSGIGDVTFDKLKDLITV